MDDYIKRDVAIMTAMNYEGSGNAQDASQDIAAELASIPAADVVEVVRCQDCKFCNFLLGKRPLCLGGAAWKPIKENDFCAWGERSENNGP